MLKPNIREEAANKLNFFDLICERIIEGKPVSVDMAKKARADIQKILAWLDKRKYKTDKK
jgi:hypothetical protein